MHNYFNQYDNRDRWISYWQQIENVLSLQPKKVLEIGIGNKTVTNYLRERGVEVTTLDINESLKPDIVASVEKMPLADNSFDAVLAAEILEHLPFEKFVKALLEIRRVTKKHAVISVPHWGWTFYLVLKIPLVRKLQIMFKIQGFLRHQFNGEHYWEIGKRSFPLSKIKKEISRAGFKILTDFISADSPYHHFFILEKV
ncbi:MAG: Methyltransferase type 11 [Candidatus Magasanikbacteria bacterium GW2011_GWC2_41_17]|uniref:Methyltransferase type 11 n=2 Tax=Candidatus Magasanikiibacteriota TaxID=1752731 RepID=A0A0G0WLK2_9BACT|nr:MAG: Methyltransferase type 11 [Candidatus Magasanikbacteria bacterium GW2011_GWC2_41_17]KKS13670.1 MAG: Methyltransferase type 11 [Candidatus Magasanikbacteria bacterium GW2011_GWA2_41_55]